MTWPELSDAFAAELVGRGRARKTVESMQRWVQLFAEYCHARGAKRPADVSATHAVDFERRLYWEPGPHGKLYAQNSVQNCLGMVRLCMRWAVARGVLLLDPFRDVRTHRVEAAEGRVLTADQVELLLRAPDVFTAVGLRDRALLEVLYGTGMRRMECRWLDVPDFDAGTLTLAVRRAKGGRAHLQPITTRVARTLERYLELGRPQLGGAPGESALFLSTRGLRLHHNAIDLRLRAYGQLSGLGPLGAHVLRRSFATHLLEGGARLEDVRRLLGHDSLSSTHVYTRLEREQVAAEHARTHPRSRRKLLLARGLLPLS